ncbi:DUF6480 family protein [Rhodococcus sp. 06-1460-1B]|uniref:DUF6480 family protein n=1 Tax=Rhodococcus sp. 06-1460-1B TaxID=2022501 RepID=UPI000B9C1688|nr:DUF6480 family protein [Rhodococcus sp. 06-1460-1B]OZD59845.1 hypothetical protein CH268_14565 [Rhodococcus sp. 06-1460-1B]OZD59983.1 hypothetical protein CH268_15380 [Rhodococcus sp. 06-1460-1B]
MTAQNPEPDETAGLEAGGSVTPGDTPPAETSVGGPNHEPPQRSRVMPIVVIVLVALLAIVIAGGLVGRVVGLFG